MYEYIDIEDLREGYNRIYSTNYETIPLFLAAVYKKYKTLEKAGDCLGISAQTMFKYMKRFDIHRLPKGHRKPSPCLRKILDIGDDITNMTYLEIVKATGCSIGRVTVLLTREGIKYKRLRKWKAKEFADSPAGMTG